MKYSVIKAAPRMLRKEDAGLYVGSPKLLALMEASDWIAPAVARHKLVLYDVKKLDGCCDRLSAGEFPHAAPAPEPIAA